MRITIEELTDFICDRYGVDSAELTAKDDFESLGFDSLTIYSIVDEVEKRFKVSIDTDDITQINSLSGLYSYVAGDEK